MTLAVFSGSFDPPTNGHLDVLRRALKIFDKVVVAIGVNPQKQSMFTAAERAALFHQAIRDDAGLNASASNIEISLTTGLLAQFATEKKANAIIRGVRTVAEYESEMNMALLNRDLTGIETVLLFAEPKLSYVSSSAVKEIAAFGGVVTPFVPEVVANAVAAKRPA